MKIRSWVWSCGPTVFRERSWGTVLRMKHSRQKWIGYLLFDAAFRPSFVARLRISPRLGRIFFNKQTSNQLDTQLVIAICDNFCFKILSYFLESLQNGLGRSGRLSHTRAFFGNASRPAWQNRRSATASPHGSCYTLLNPLPNTSLVSDAEMKASICSR